MPPEIASARTTHWLWPPLLLLGCVTALIAWILVALSSRSQAGWMAVLCALEIAWMLRLGSMRSGWPRITVAVLATLTVIVAANVGIAATQIGAAMGLDPWASALKMGAGYAWTLSTLANSRSDLACYILSAMLAAWSSR